MLLVAPTFAIGLWAVVGVVGSLFTSASLLLFSLHAQKSVDKSTKSAGKRQGGDEAGLESECDEEEPLLLRETLEDAGVPLEGNAIKTEPLIDALEHPLYDAVDCDVFEEGVSPPPIEEEEPLYNFQYLLPPRESLDDQRLTVVLDLDETMVRSCEAGEVPVHMEFAASVGLLQRFEIVCVDPVTGLKEKIVSFMRPGLKEFLESVASFAEVVVFTAGDPEYAAPLLNLLDPQGKYFDHCLFRDATVSTPYHEHVKDLSLLGRNMGRTVLVDNNPYSFLFQPENGILCEGFYGDPSDRHLLESTLPMLKLLACMQDVRPLLSRRSGIDDGQQVSGQQGPQMQNLA